MCAVLVISHSTDRKRTMIVPVKKLINTSLDAMGKVCSDLSLAGVKAFRRDKIDGPCLEVRHNTLHCVHRWPSGKLECCVCGGIDDPSLNISTLRAEGLIV